MQKIIRKRIQIDEEDEESFDEDGNSKKKKDIDFSKGDTPKFEKMPKDAQDAFWKSVQKYSL